MNEIIFFEFVVNRREMLFHEIPYYNYEQYGDKCFLHTRIIK